MSGRSTSRFITSQPASAAPNHIADRQQDHDNVDDADRHRAQRHVELELAVGNALAASHGLDEAAAPIAVAEDHLPVPLD
jgi:hypothetical protein